VVVACTLALTASACHRSGGMQLFDEGLIARDTPGVVHTAYPVAAASGQYVIVKSQSEWRSLFDGKTLDAWRGYKSQTVPTGWHVVDGTITKERSTEDLITRDQFGDFELELEWKIGEAGNAGIFYRGTEEYDHIYWSGPEYQLLDNAKA